MPGGAAPGPSGDLGAVQSLTELMLLVESGDDFVLPFEELLPEPSASVFP